jgi:enoyl-[acyl-carrier protein] reductase I
MLDAVADRAPLLRRIGADEVGDTAAFLLSDLSRGITGETVYVDAGYHIMGL